MENNELKVGIDKLSFFVPHYYVDMSDLARARHVDKAKFHIGIGQDEMAVSPVTQDIVTFAASAANQILDEQDKALVDLVIVATESSIDESKASAVIVHGLLGIQPFARSIEMKEACYAATAGIASAVDYVRLHPERKALVIASDLAKYGLNSGGEPTQGAGAVAMLISSNPKILFVNDDALTLTQDVYDFWRPTGQTYPSVDGQFSNAVYIESFSRVWDEYAKRTASQFSDFAALAFHTPYTKMGKKALLPKLENETESVKTRLLTQFERAITYNRRIGNLYTGSLYLSLISLLENSETLKAGDKIGLFSYGSGAVAEFYSVELVSGFDQHLKKNEHELLLHQREKLSIRAYEKMFEEKIDLNHNERFSDETPYAISEIKANHRLYRQK